MRFTLFDVILILAIALSLFCNSVHLAGIWTCRPCLSGNCNKSPKDCEWGLVENLCGQKVCGQGPGQRCGGSMNKLGQCGKGMMCIDEICTGCYYDEAMDYLLCP